jgi:hypothetical protein
MTSATGPSHLAVTRYHILAPGGASLASMALPGSAGEHQIAGILDCRCLAKEIVLSMVQEAEGMRDRLTSRGC